MHTLRCPKCRKYYNLDGIPKQFCPSCMILEENEYQIVRQLVKENPGITIDVTAERTGVSRTKIIRYVKEERLEILRSSGTFFKCASCGKNIFTGEYCEECRRRFGGNAPKVVSKTPPTTDGTHLDGTNRGI